MERTDSVLTPTQPGQTPVAAPPPDVDSVTTIPAPKLQDASGPVYHVSASGGRAKLDLHEMWEHRELLYFLIWRDIKVRYKQTVIGVGWAIIQPFVNMLVFSLFFGQIARIPSNGIPYPVFSFAALVPWTYFSNAIGQGADSLVGNAHLLRKVYFPRLFMPMGRVLAGLLDFGLAFAVLLVMMLLFGIVPTLPGLLTLPLLILLIIVSATGISLWLSALNVRFRDVRYIVPFLIQVWMFASPVVYPATLIPEPWRTLYGINPMTGVIEGFRWALLGDSGFSAAMLLVSFLSATILLITGLAFFSRAEGFFADTV